jgi:hypothetical protein
VHRVIGDDRDPLIEPGLGDPGPGDGRDDGKLDNGCGEPRVGPHGRDRPRPGSATDVEQPVVRVEVEHYVPRWERRPDPALRWEIPG